jgi:ATP-binding cassette subfamily B protein
VLRREQRAVFVGNSIGALTSALFTIGTAAALALAVWLFRRGEITIGTVFLIFMYTQMLAQPIQTIQRQIADLQAASAAIHRVYELLDATPNVVDGPGAALPAGALSVRFERVDFRYIEHEPLLRDVSLELEAGRVLGVLGRTGSGKTTISRLLLRFYDPDAGTVRVGEIDVRQPTLAQLRGRIGLVTQDVQLFHASVRDNLTFFESTITDTAVESAVREVGLGDWYDNLPDGLNTTITSRGTGLSAGEAQLLAFARVFLRNPGLVILDEATSRLDPVTEGRVEHAVNRLFEGRTAVVIAHRLRTVLRADQIAVIDDGAIVEHGDRITLGADPASRFSRLLAAGMEDARS